MQSKAVNQKRGPTTGNVGTGSKRDEFMTAKAKSGNQRSELAQSVITALETRGNGMKSFRDPSVEPLKAKVNVGRGPTKGNKA
jgi:hypothetical protein